MSRGHLLERLAVQLLAGNADDLAGGLRAERRRSRPILDLRALADDRTWAELTDHLTVDNHLEHPVEHEVDERRTLTRFPLFDEDVACGNGCRARLAVAAHDLQGELALHRALDGCDNRRGVFIPP